MQKKDITGQIHKLANEVLENRRLRKATKAKDAKVKSNEVKATMVKAGKVKVTKEQTKAIYDATWKVLRRMLREGVAIRIDAFGTFTRNPHKGGEVTADWETMERKKLCPRYEIHISPTEDFKEDLKDDWRKDHPET